MAQKYSKEFRIKVAKEASLLENDGLERVIAGKYGLLPSTVKRWRDHYQEYGDKVFYRGYTKKDTRTPREIELERENEELKEEVKILKKSSGLPGGCKPQVKYEFMHCNKEEFPIVRMARVQNVSESGYNEWRKQKESPPTDRDKEDARLLHEIKEIYYGSRGSYGSRKITRIVNKNRIHRVNHKRVERLMSENGLYSRVFRKYRVTTDSNYDFMIADNLID